MDQLCDSRPLTPETLDYLREWEGCSETLVETITSQPVGGLAATLDLTDVDTEAGSPLPPLWHWMYFTPRPLQSEIGVDGHPRPGGFLPPVPLPRRMWAGSRLEWHGVPRIGQQLQRTSTIKSVNHKSGRTGDLIFIVVRHEYSDSNGAQPVLTEEQDLVYRAPAQPGDPAPPPKPAPKDAIWSKEITPDSVLLFRYSALTFNGHRIHYDRPYAVEEEGYPGLVVHGPLIATLLAELGRRESSHKWFRSFNVRAVRATCDLHPFLVCGKPSDDGNSADLWAQDHEGCLTIQAEVIYD